MRSRIYQLSLFLAVTVGLFGALSIEGPASVQAAPLDICQITAWDSTGHVLHDGDTVGGDGTFNLIFRVEDDPFGYINDFLDGPVQDLIQPLEDSIAQLTQQVATQQATVDDLQSQLDAMNPNDLGYTALQSQLSAAKLDLQSTQVELAADQEVLDEFSEALNNFRQTDIVLVDPQVGAAGITSKMEVTGFEWVKPRIDHELTGVAGLLNQRVDHVWPNWFTDADGHDVDNISDWLTNVVGVSAPTGIDANNVCGAEGTVDGWGYVDMTCTSPGSFNVNVIPNFDHPQSEVTNGTIHLVCPGVVDTATISASPTSLEIQPVGSNVSSTTLTVATLDQFGKRINGGHVTWQTDNCKLVQSGVGSTISPAGGGAVVENFSNTNGTSDAQFLINNPLETAAGTAEVALDCSDPVLSHAGTANVQAIVDRPGADIVLTQAIKVVGPPAKIALVLDPTSLTCGDPVKATATISDAVGNPVSDGTFTGFTTDTSTGVSGGIQAGGAQGQTAAITGIATVQLATDPGNPGTHTVVAYTGGLDKNGHAVPVVSTTQTYNCSATSAVSAEVHAPELGGTSAVSSQITPPNTGNAGLRAGSHDSSSTGFALAISSVLLFVIAFAGWRLEQSR